MVVDRRVEDRPFHPRVDLGRSVESRCLSHTREVGLQVVTSRDESWVHTGTDPRDSSTIIGSYWKEVEGFLDWGRDTEL